MVQDRLKLLIGTGLLVALLGLVIVVSPGESDFTHRRGVCLRCWIPGIGHHHHSSDERKTASSLLTIVAAQVDYRDNDRDGNGKKDYWRGDIAGLYGLCPPGTDEMIKLLEISVAGADPDAVDRGTTPPVPGKMTGQSYYATRAPKAGHWFRALRHADEKTPDPDRFAACAFPDSRSAGRWTYIVDERQVIWKRDLNGGRISVFPTDQELEKEWRKAR